MNKVAVITGGATGIGRAAVKEFNKHGYRVVILYNTSRDDALNLANELNGNDSLVALPIKANVLDYGGIMVAFEQIIKVFGRIDVVVNNAGVSLNKLFIDCDKSDWEQVVGVNLGGTYNVCRAAVPYMLSDGGCIVNVASMWGRCGASGEVIYSAAKAGVIGLTKALAKELAYNKVRVNCVSPGAVDTAMMSHEYSAEQIQEIIGNIPLGRMASPIEIARAIYFLAESEYTTGEIMDINGGYRS